MKVKIFLAALAFIFITGTASAQAPQTPKKACNVDANNNSVCDKSESGTCAKGNGKGLQDGSGKVKSLGGSSGRKNGKGKGCAKGVCDGSGKAIGSKGANFVDANNNGVCDKKEAKK